MTATTYDRTQAIRIIRTAGLTNAATIYDAADQTGLPLSAACALLQKESGGNNVYGHDQGGALAGYPGGVDESNYRVFRWLIRQGANSNGVGPCQLTYTGFFDDMEAKGQKPWLPVDNMRYGFTLLETYHQAALKAGDPNPWITAGTRYNGANEYGIDLAAKTKVWRSLLAPAAT